MSNGFIVTTTDGGTTWTNRPYPGGITLFTGVSCGSTSQCIAVPDGSIFITSDGGITWAQPTLPYGISGLTGVSCGSTSNCAAVSINGPTGINLVVTTANGGATWTNPIRPPGFPVLQLEGISCPSASDCLAVGPGVISSSDGGATWTKQTIPSGTGVLAVSCGSSSNCVATGAGVIATTDGGTNWVTQGVSTVFPFDGLGVSCASALDCVVVGYAVEGKFGPFPPVIAATTDGGTTWTTQSVPTGTDIVSRVSCGSTSDCVAVGTASGAPVTLATTNGGATWTTQNVPSAVSTLAGISCPSSADCVAVGNTSSNSGVAMATTNGGSIWTIEKTPGVAGLAGVSCASSTDCVAVGGGMIIGTGSAFDLAPTSTTASVNPANTISGSPVSFSTSVAPTAGPGTPTGTVTFSIDSSSLCTATLSGGSGSCISSGAPVGLDNVTATYSGDTAFAASSATTSLSVKAFGITTTSLPPGTVSAPYSYQLTAAGGTMPYRWKKTAALPRGLKLSSSGLISGSPNARRVPPGSYPVSVQVKDSTRRNRQTATATFTLVLN
ncbi:MAG TPA: Ig-like domain-containing protein [Acidimicrobiales bacterium]|nr:Ig-like domain-containing protein [Acidimicrobiales bacterium]